MTAAQAVGGGRMSPALRRALLPLALAQFICSFAGSNMNRRGSAEIARLNDGPLYRRSVGTLGATERSAADDLLVRRVESNHGLGAPSRVTVDPSRAR